MYGSSLLVAYPMIPNPVECLEYKKGLLETLAENTWIITLIILIITIVLAIRSRRKNIAKMAIALYFVGTGGFNLILGLVSEFAGGLNEGPSDVTYLSRIIIPIIIQIIPLLISIIKAKKLKNKEGETKCQE